MRGAAKFRPGHLATACLIAIAGCSRLENVGQEPKFTPAGQMIVDTPPVTPERIALATPTQSSLARRVGPQNYNNNIHTASLWRSGPTSLFGDRRAQGRGDILTVVIEIDDEPQSKTPRNGTAMRPRIWPLMRSSAFRNWWIISPA